jgi:hypothetical protein
MAIKLVNESALGIYTFSWQAAGNKRCELSWYEGLALPAFSFHVSALGRMSPAVPVRDPERFAPWPLPAGNAKKTLAGFKAFATAFAEKAEEQDGEL